MLSRAASVAEPSWSSRRAPPPLAGTEGEYDAVAMLLGAMDQSAML